MLASSTPGAERERVQQMVDALTREHRDIERQWNALEPQLKKFVKGQSVELDAPGVASLIAQSHATGSASTLGSRMCPRYPDTGQPM